MTHWKRHPDFTRYEVSDDGRVRVAATGVEVAQRERGQGGQGSQVPLLRVDLRQGGRRRTASVHVLVMEAHGPGRPSGAHYVRHRNGDVLDNAIGNLSWERGKERAS